MPNQLKISIIIPAYNAAATLPRCLDSIYAVGLQEQDFEVIAVDDCSTDNTLASLTDYADQHTNMRVLHQTHNQRQGAARNRGIKEAQGEYIAFVDADDEVSEGLIKALQYALAVKIDMLFCCTAWEDELHQFTPRIYDIPTYEIISNSEFAEKYYDVVCVGPWTYLWSKSFLQQTDIPFIENRRMEDFDFVERHLLSSTSVAYCDSPIYFYHINQGSTVRTLSPDTVADWVHVSYRRLKMLQKLGGMLPLFAEKVEYQCCCFVESSISLRRLSRLPAKEITEMYQHLGSDALHFLQQRRWSAFTAFALRHPRATTAIFTIVSPIAKLARQIVRTLR